MEQIVNKCLDKDKEYRYQRIDDLMIDLRRLKRETSGTSITASDLKRTIPKTKTKKKYLWLGSIALIVITMIFALIFWPFKSGVQLNPNRTMRTLNLPFKQIMYPSISADGNWIAFPAADVDGNWNVYLAHSTSGESPIRVVKENETIIWTAEISPDGSYVLYSQLPGVRIIPTSGGIPKVLDSLSYFINSQWRPDSRRIGGMIREGTYDEFWTSSLDGNDLRKEFADSVGQKLFRNFGFAWSPDGKSVAWLRDFYKGSGYQEIFTRELETGKEKQITFNKSNIEAVCWSSQNVLIFSSTISGPLNLWMVPSEGGEPIQITSGDGPDGPPKISNDGSKLIYLKIKMVGQFMIVPISGGEPKLVTAGEQTVWGSRLSPDGRQVVVNVGDLSFGWVGIRSHLYLMDRDGNNRRRITAGDKENLFNYCWSPDGKLLAFESNHFFNSLDSISDVYILDVVGNNQPKKVASLGVYQLTWIDSLNLSIRAPDKFYTYNINQDKMVEDTVLYYPIKARPEILMQDLEGNWWIIKNNKKNKLEPPKNGRLSLRNFCWMQWEEGKPFRTISVIDGKVKEYPKLIGPKLLAGNRYILSDDGKEIIFSTQELSGQISMIENPFLK